MRLKGEGIKPLGMKYRFSRTVHHSHQYLLDFSRWGDSWLPQRCEAAWKWKGALGGGFLFECLKWRYFMDRLMGCDAFAVRGFVLDRKRHGIVGMDFLKGRCCVWGGARLHLIRSTPVLMRWPSRAPEIIPCTLAGGREKDGARAQPFNVKALSEKRFQGADLSLLSSQAVMYAPWLPAKAAGFVGNGGLISSLKPVSLWPT